MYSKWNGKITSHYMCHIVNFNFHDMLHMKYHMYNTYFLLNIH